ncbi:MAG: hypothetical protein WA821_21435, partial [Anaerolineales bacterium]
VYTERVTMRQYVDIEGSGELTTKITFTGSTSWDGTSSTLLGANNAELRFLTVENTGGAAYAFAIYNSSAAPRLTHVTATASGGTESYGVFNSSSSPTMTNVIASASGGTYSIGVQNVESSPTMTHVIASASGGTHNMGVNNNNPCSPMMTDVTASASGGTDSYGVYNGSGSPTMTNVIASASGATMYNDGVFNSSSASPTMTNVTASASGGMYSYGVRNYSSSATINNSVISASGGTNNYGIYNTTNHPEIASTVRVNNSQISGSTNTIVNDTNFTTLIGGSQLYGGPVDTSAGGTLTCAGVYDENYTFYASTCP